MRTRPAGRLRVLLARAGADRRLLLALGAGLVVRLGLLSAGLFEPGRYYAADSDRYLRLARDLSGAYLDSDSPHFDLGLERPPGYPLFLWATGGTRHPVLTVSAHVLLGLVTIFLTYRLGQRLLDQRAATAAALVVAVDPNTAAHGNTLLSETLFTATVLGSVVLLAGSEGRPGPRRCLAGGLVLGLAVLVRPIALLLPIAVVPVLWFLWRGPAKQKGAAALAVVVGFSLPVGAWTVRNAVVTGVPMVSTVLGSELLLSGAGSAVQEEQGQVSLHEEGNPVTGAVRDDADRDAARRSRSQAGAALRLIRDHPVGMARALLRGAARTFLGPGEGALLATVFGNPRPGDEILVLPPDLPKAVTRGALGLHVGFLAVLYAGAALGATKLVLGRRYAVLALLLALIVYFGFSAPGLAGYSRYRLPCIPYLALLAGAGYSLLRGRWGAPSRRPALPTCHSVSGTELGSER